MGKQLTCVLFIILSFLSFGQKARVDQILSLKEEKVLSYSPEMASAKQLYLKMGYGSSVISNATEVKKINGAKIARIDIVYSDHPHGDTYPSLTRKRIEKLIKMNPSLFKNKDIEWKLVRQTDCTDKSSAQKLFHGIVISYRPVQSKELIAEEISYLDSVFLKPRIENKSKQWTYSETFYLDSKTGEKKIISKSDTIYKEYDTASEGYVPSYGHSDSVVQAVLRRNNWVDMAIIADLTGSMSPYTAQLLVWFKLNTTNDRVKQFVFFNDGDLTPDHRKIIGKTGGIYDTRSSKFEEVQKLAYTTMTNGSGGDFPENNIEALMKAIELCPNCTNMVLIADNWASVKDISLIKNINKPIKIILCGADYEINTEYLDLARATGGSVHTIEADLTELMNLNEGQEISIGGQTFIIEKGKFIKISKT